MSQPQLLAIVWTDSHSEPAGWRWRDEVKPLDVTVCSVGWVLAKTKTALVLAAHLTSDQAHTPITIPRASILRVRRMKFPIIERS